MLHHVTPTYGSLTFIKKFFFAPEETPCSYQLIKMCFPTKCTFYSAKYFFADIKDVSCIIILTKCLVCSVIPAKKNNFHSLFFFR